MIYLRRSVRKWFLTLKKKKKRLKEEITSLRLWTTCVRVRFLALLQPVCHHEAASMRTEAGSPWLTEKTRWGKNAPQLPLWAVHTELNDLQAFCYIKQYTIVWFMRARDFCYKQLSTFELIFFILCIICYRQVY